MIVVDQLVHRFGSRSVLDGVSFRARPGEVTGFLGPNGSGKTTTMRALLGLIHPTSGSTTVNGRHYSDHVAPLHEVGVLLDGPSVHQARSATGSLRMLAATHGIGRRRVDEVLACTGLGQVADRAVSGYSLGMRQRLGIAAALLGNPATLVFDEPANGLDPEGIIWLRELMRALADEGRTVLCSSHLIAEVARIADRVVVLGRGSVVADEPLSVLTARADPSVVVDGPDLRQLVELIRTNDGVSVDPVDSGRVAVRGMAAIDVSRIAGSAGIALSELSPHRGSLEDVYRELTQPHVAHTGGTP